MRLRDGRCEVFGRCFVALLGDFYGNLFAVCDVFDSRYVCFKVTTRSIFCFVFYCVALCRFAYNNRIVFLAVIGACVCCDGTHNRIRDFRFCRWFLRAVCRDFNFSGCAWVVVIVSCKANIVGFTCINCGITFSTLRSGITACKITFCFVLHCCGRACDFALIPLTFRFYSFKMFRGCLVCFDNGESPCIFIRACQVCSSLISIALFNIDFYGVCTCIGNFFHFLVASVEVVIGNLTNLARCIALCLNLCNFYISVIFQWIRGFEREVSCLQRVPVNGEAYCEACNFSSACFFACCLCQLDCCGVGACC